MQKKAFADVPAGIVGEVYEKPRGSCGLEGSDSSDYINLELFKIIIFKGSYKQLLGLSNTAVKNLGAAHDSGDAVWKEIRNHITSITIHR